MRAASIHGMAGMAAYMASTYKASAAKLAPGPLPATRRCHAGVRAGSGGGHVAARKSGKHGTPELAQPGHASIALDLPLLTLPPLQPLIRPPFPPLLQAYLGEGMGPLEWITKFKIPHPGRVVGQVTGHAGPGLEGSWLCGMQSGQPTAHVRACSPAMERGCTGSAAAAAKCDCLRGAGLWQASSPTILTCSPSPAFPSLLPPSRPPYPPLTNPPTITATTPCLQVVMKLTMPGTMSRILGGFRKALSQTNRLPVCNLADQPQVGTQAPRHCTPRPST